MNFNRVLDKWIIELHLKNIKLHLLPIYQNKKIIKLSRVRVINVLSFKLCKYFNYLPISMDAFKAAVI